MVLQVAENDVFDDVTVATLWVTGELVPPSQFDPTQQPIMSIIHVTAMLDSAVKAGILRSTRSVVGFMQPVETALGVQVVTTHRHYLRMADVLEFAKTRGDIPGFLKSLLRGNAASCKVAANAEESGVQTSKAPMHSGRWPWGDYETELLRKLEGAAREWWSSYDPEQPSTAPMNEQVMEWLKAEGVSVRVAEVMAQILRADGLPPGPRK